MADRVSEKRKKVLDWSELSHDHLVEIARRIDRFKDFVAFRRACRSWRSAATMDNFRGQPLLTPFFLLLCRHVVPHQRFLYNLSSRQPCDINVQGPSRGARFFASQGWLVEADGLQLQLRNPFHGATIQLPDFRCARCYGDIKRFILSTAAISSNPSFTSDYTVIVAGSLYRSDTYKAFVWRPGHGNVPGCNHPGWLPTMLELPERDYILSRDVAYVRGKCVNLDKNGSLLAADCSSIDLVAKLPEELLVHGALGIYDEKHLLESERGLLVIIHRAGLLGPGGLFQIFELDWETKQWKEVIDLGDRALFFSKHSSAIFLDSNGFKANSIYFTFGSMKEKMGIYDLATKSYEFPIEFQPSDAHCLRALWIFQTEMELSVKPDA